MNTFKTETEYAINNIEYDSYRSRIEEYEDEFRTLSDSLNKVKIEELEKRGYSLITIDDIDMLVPEDISFQEMHTSLQQMPRPHNRRYEFALYYFVDEDDISIIKNSDNYKKVIYKRESLLNDILNVYKEFWENEVSKASNNIEESVVYFLAGIDRNISADKISKATGIDKEKCKGYSFDDEGYVFKR